VAVRTAAAGNKITAFEAARETEGIDMRCAGSNAAGRTDRSLQARLLFEESGADMIEYALIATLIALAAVATIQGVGTKIASYYSNITSSL
jgi:pilus assembly protein Flp/PilA